VTITDAPSGYPAHRIADVVLKDGSTVRLRPVLSSDAEALVEMFEGLSEETTYMRFHTRHRVTPKEVEFGPLVACGAGGVLVELQRDVATRLTPLTDADVDDMLRSLKTFPLLEGYRGSPRLEVAALRELLLRVGMMVEDLPQLSELDLNPVMVLPDGEGGVALDARRRIAEPAPTAPRGSRRRPPPG
jgi:acyl-CoA synthetase (NDP forming)